MKPSLQLLRLLLLCPALIAGAAFPALAAATITQQVDPIEANIGDQVVITLTLQGGTVGNLQLPPVDGLQIVGTQSATNIVISNGGLSRNLSMKFAVVPSRVGDIVIPAFDVQTQEGEVLHVKAMKIHVLGDAPPAPPTTNAIATPASPTAPAVSTNSANPAPNPNGPVVTPPQGTAPNPAIPNLDTTDDASDLNLSPPRDKDGTPVKVFLVITVQTTDAYVGQSIPMRIDFYIRMDVNADQNSLPTIKGSDFLMNNFTTRGRASLGMLEGQQYGRESWITAISAPKSGDFPLVMQRDTYWIKSINPVRYNFFGGYFNPRAQLAHEPITSNQLVIHVHPLPTEGQPAHFTGAIGQFQVTSDAQPSSVAVGEPVTLNFSVAGEGNFDYVRSPVLADNSDWKSYVPSARINYRDESHTHAVKTFQQAIIPKKNGVVPLPGAAFSYFDPVAKKYVTVPLTLPPINVTGSALPAASAANGPDSGSASVSMIPSALEFLPNRGDIGVPRLSIVPAYRQTWFWFVEAGLLCLPLLGALVLFLRSRVVPIDDRAERELRVRSLQREEDSMSEAVRKGDAGAFFVAARHALQLQLGAQWNVKPEALTLGEIRSRDTQLAESLEPFFAQADEVIYSGRASTNLDLVEWDRRARELLQLETA